MMRYKHYSPHSKMADLVCDHYSILLLINRFGISLGMGEKTIKEICDEHDVDVDTFLYIVHFLLFDVMPDDENKPELSIPQIITFLRNSHSYFLDFRLPEIRCNMNEAIEDAPEDIQFVIGKYFDEYSEEVHQHMKYEDQVVFPYVDGLLNGVKDKDYSIETFQKRHDQVELKMVELKSIFIKYYANSGNKVNNMLHELFTCSEELLNHNSVEDYIFIPCVKELERRL
mgnify:CR=1 FL=1